MVVLVSSLQTFSFCIDERVYRSSCGIAPALRDSVVSTALCTEHTNAWAVCRKQHPTCCDGPRMLAGQSTRKSEPSLCTCEALQGTCRALSRT
jgi:hypothetical protein